MSRSLRIGRILGITIALHYSWFVIFAVVFLTLSSFYFPTYHPNWPSELYWLIGLATAILFFASVLAHELAHSMVALRHGIPVKDITLFILGGVANIKKEADSPSTELAIAAAGPGMSVLLSAFFLGVWYVTRGIFDPLSALAFYLGTTNGMLALFNTIPGFPLDGGRILRAALWRLTNNFRRATRIASLSGQILAYLFVLAGLASAVLGSWANGVWLVFMGWFLHAAAESSYQQSIAYDMLKGVPVSEVMSRDYPVVDEYLSLRQVVEQYASRYNLMAFPVVHGSIFVGAVSVDKIKRVPEENWGRMSVQEVMTSVENLETLDPEACVDQALERLDQEETAQIPVVESGHVVGLLTKSKILQFLKNKEELDKAA
jgi:Zn-dependent protease/CBS domain-containing protein